MGNCSFTSILSSSSILLPFSFLFFSLYRLRIHYKFMLILFFSCPFSFLVPYPSPPFFSSVIIHVLSFSYFPSLFAVVLLTASQGSIGLFLSVNQLVILSKTDLILSLSIIITVLFTPSLSIPSLVIISIISHCSIYTSCLSLFRPNLHLFTLVSHPLSLILYTSYTSVLSSSPSLIIHTF